MKTIILVIGIIKKGNRILLRKKPDGSPPYKETWYLFGGELNSEQYDPSQAIIGSVKTLTGVDIKVNEKLFWNTEIKNDKTGELAFHIYLDCMCEYLSGELVPAEGIEKLEWVDIENLKDYDLVPPSVELFKQLGYL